MCTHLWHTSLGPHPHTHTHLPVGASVSVLGRLLVWSGVREALSQAHGKRVAGRLPRLPCVSSSITGGPGRSSLRPCERSHHPGGPRTASPAETEPASLRPCERSHHPGAPALRLPLEQSRPRWLWTPLRGQASLGVLVRPQGCWWLTCPECSRCCCLGELTLPPAWVPGGAEPLSSGALGWPCPQPRPFPLLTRGPWRRPQLAVSPHLLGRGPCHCEAVPQPCVYVAATERAVMLPASRRGAGTGVPLYPGFWAWLPGHIAGAWIQEEGPRLTRGGSQCQGAARRERSMPILQTPHRVPQPHTPGSRISMPHPWISPACLRCRAPSRGPLAQRAPVARQGDLPRTRGHVSLQ